MSIRGLDRNRPPGHPRCSIQSTESEAKAEMAVQPPQSTEESEENLYPIAVLIDELRNEDVQVSRDDFLNFCRLLHYFASVSQFKRFSRDEC